MILENISKVDSISTRFPLLLEREKILCFSETTHVFEVPIHLSGFLAELGGESIVGSAAELAREPLFRAYMELVERLSIVTAMLRPIEGVRLVGAERTPGFGPCTSLFPETPDPSRQRWARSNGVAAGTTWIEAASRARWELIERDRILRSFYGEIQPRRVAVPNGLVPDGLRAGYAFHAYTFDAPVPDGASVAMLIGFPRKVETDPLVYGFGCRNSEHAAVEVAAGECIQRLGFLYGETLPDSAPPPAPTPDFHQEYFLFAENHERLRRWLDGEHAEFRGVLDASVARVPDEPVYADLTPPSLEGRLFVAKALPRGHVPLAFGVGHPFLRSNAPVELSVHPIA